MLPAAYRLRDGEGFRAATRRGDRMASRTLVAHLRLPDSSESDTESRPLVGFVVGRQVGPAVVRNRVKRRLRHLLRPRLGVLPGGSSLVLRAKPAAGGASSIDLEADVDRLFLRFGLERL